MGLRYFISAVLDQTPDRIAVVSVQRSRRKGHVTRREIALMHRLCPHLQRAYRMRTLLALDAPPREAVFEDALDLIADGIALSGMTAVAYAQSRGVSITSVYTHLR